MCEVKSVKYLVNIVSENGSIKETIEDRRKSGWGKFAQILGILGEVNMGAHRVRVGLLLRKAILTSSLLFTAEAWHNVTDQDLKRLEQVDISLLRGIMNSHSKSANVFHYLETGSLMLRHLLTINRLMYHQHLLTRNSSETIKKIYMKQKIDCVKGDWFHLLKKDFQFIGVDMDEEEIIATPKSVYKAKIKKVADKSCFSRIFEPERRKEKVR